MPLIIQEKATLQAGDNEGEDNLKWLNLDSVQLPDLEEISDNHQAGGTHGEIDWGSLGFKALKPTFKLKGWDQQVLGLFYRSRRQTWTVRGLLRDKKSQTPIALKAVFEARIGKIGSEAFEAGKTMGHDHEMAEVVHYRLSFDGIEKFYWHHFEPAFRINGVDMLDEERRILALPGA